MLVHAQRRQPVAEDLILVVIDHDALSVVVLGGEEPVHPAWVFEAVVQHDWGIADLAQIVERVAVELSHCVYRDLSHDRLVERLDRHDHILHIWLGVSLVEDAQRLMRVRDAVCVTPLWVRLFPSAVVEAVLALRGTMQVNDDFEPRLACPCDRLVQIGCGALRVGTPGVDVQPVADGDAHDV